jgi:hypothetical protein
MSSILLIGQEGWGRPVNFWYKGELGFFDNYIIPWLKSSSCGVFGVSSDECLNYAMENRREEMEAGEQIVRDLVSSFEERRGG